MEDVTDMGVVDWLGDLEPGVVAALVSLIVTVLTLVVSTFVAPRIKFSFDQRLEDQKLELAYR
jgi:hypothetical protein